MRRKGHLIRVEWGVLELELPSSLITTLLLLLFGYTVVGCGILCGWGVASRLVVNFLVCCDRGVGVYYMNLERAPLHTAAVYQISPQAIGRIAEKKRYSE